MAALIHDGKALQLDRGEAIMEENGEYDKRQQKMAWRAENARLRRERRTATARHHYQFGE